MKYIRTEDGVYRVMSINEEHIVYDFDGDDSPRHTYLKYVVKQADTIEELCDFIVEMKDRKIFHIVDIREHKTNWNCFLHSNDKYAIETNKGLIYVAKMNGKGELELL